jgi:transposase
LPERFGDWKNTYKRFSHWAASGVWESLFKPLADDPDDEYAMIDATIIRAHQYSAEAPKKGVAAKPSAARAEALRAKIDVIVDAQGNILAFSLTGGNTNDITQAEPLAAQVEAKAVLGDKEYDADSFITSLEVRAIKGCHPQQSTRKFKRTATLNFTPSALSSDDSSMPSRMIEVLRHAFNRKPRSPWPGARNTLRIAACN